MTNRCNMGIPLLWRGGENSERIFDGVVLAPIVTVTPQQAIPQTQDKLACEEYEWIAGIAPENE